MDVVAVAYARDATEAGLIQGLLEDAGIASSLQRIGINGPMVGVGLLNPGGGASRVMVMADRAEEARALLRETLVEDPQAAFPEPVNAEYLADRRDRRPRGYGLLGAYARIYLWSFAAMALIFAAFLLLHAL
jgi:hypothetical protein